MKYCSICGDLVEQKVPEGDSISRWVCGACHTVHYQNPKIVVGCVTASEGKILLCKRSIEPRYGYWTVPAGFLEIGETIAEGAARETMEEACAKIEIGHLFAAVDVVDAAQLHLFFTGTLVSDFAAGHESLDAQLFARDAIPWDEIAFRSGFFALEKYLEDAGQDNGVHLHEVRRGKG